MAASGGRLAGRRRGSRGFTLTELMVASAIGVLVTAAVLTCFLWCGHEASLCAKIAWSQNEAMRTAQKIGSYVQNASAVHGIDQVQGTWIELGFPDGSLQRLVYSNAIPLLRDGRLYLQKTNGTEMIVARGLTEIMDDVGYTTPIFQQTRTNMVRIAYRVSEPAASGGRASDDGPYAASVRFGACLRNAAP